MTPNDNPENDKTFDYNNDNDLKDITGKNTDQFEDGGDCDDIN